MTDSSLKIGLLPFYLELYDEVLGDDQKRDVRAFAGVIQAEYENRAVAVVAGEACRTSDEFARAVVMFESAAVDAIVTLHLAYSPSLESIDAVCGTNLPVVILDTTPDFGFGFTQGQDRILFNHGIHGVQDFCNLLIRRGKPFSIEAGHWKESDVIDRTISAVRDLRDARGLSAARGFRNQRVGIVGSSFHGMGDFAVPFDQLERAFGIVVVEGSSESVAAFMPSTDSDEVRAEIVGDLSRFKDGGITTDAHAESVATGLGMRRWIEQERLDAVTFNFRDITGPPGLPVVPFLEASKGMARGIGYAGEGDVLTASLCAAVARADQETTFTEMFCPDWEAGRLFMSHMGEMNIRVTERTPVLELRPYPFSDAGEPVVAAGCLRPGNALLLNVAPGPDNSFTLVAASVEVCDTEGEETIATGIRGWIRPQPPLPEFLERYSMNGGTHHCVLSYNLDTRFARAFAAELGWRFVLVDSKGNRQ